MCLYTENWDYDEKTSLWHAQIPRGLAFYKLVAAFFHHVDVY